MATKIASRKAKGRNLQKTVRDAVLQEFPFLTEDDVRSTSMGASGTDVQLSTKALEVFPYDVECKNTETINVWKAYEQSKERTREGLNPLLIIKKNGKKPLAVIDFDLFMKLNGESI